MDMKTILVTALLATLLAGIITFGYLTYTLYSDNANKGKTGAEVVKSHQMLFYIQLTTYIIALGLGGCIFYKG